MGIPFFISGLIAQPEGKSAAKLQVQNDDAPA
jgi:hypothetical protein